MNISLTGKSHIERIITYYIYLHVNYKHCRLDKIVSDFTLGLFNNPSKEKEHIHQLISNEKCNISFNNFNTFKLTKVIGSKQNNSFHYTVYGSGGVSLYQFTKTIPKILYDNLLTSLNKKCNKSIIIQLVFIYSILGFDTGQFWGVHPNFYKLVNEHYNVVECFASPFNHSLINYYSPIDYLDICFGSSGNFFEKFVNASFDCYVINPPFVLSIMDKVFKLSLLKLENTSKIVIYYYLPYWEDIIDAFINQLKKNYVNHHIFKKYETYVHDYINDKDIPNNNFELVVICASNREHLEPDKIFTKLIDVIKR